MVGLRAALGSLRTAPPPVEVGEAARKDILVSRASLEASRILYEYVVRGGRDAYLRRRVARYGPEAWTRFRAERTRLLRDRNANQATYDALRLVIVNHLARDLVRRMEAAAKSGGLGMNDTERQVACAVTGGLTLVTGLIGSIYGGQAGGGAATAGGSVAASAFGCDREQRESAERIARANADAASVQVQAALAAAQAQERTAQLQAASREKQTKLLLVGGGGLVLTLALGYFVLKV
jgi:hypothetical protein